MTSYKKFASFSVLLTASVLALAGCSSEQKPAAGSPEALLSAEGDWTLVEDSQLPDPAAQHMQSRNQVSPTDMSEKRSYTQDAKTAQVTEDVHFRVLRLERQMDALQGEFDKILPPLADKAEADQRLSVAARDVQTARTAGSAQQNAPANDLAPLAPAKGVMVAPPKLAPEPVKTADAPKTVAAQPVAVASNGPAQVTKLRLGEHPGKTRLVMDASRAASFTADLDTAENLIVVEIKGAGWAAPEKASFAKHPLIKSYAAEKTENGARLILALAKPAKIEAKMTLPPNATYPAHRLVLDIAPQ